jgi:Protein of unknown function (DUF616)
MSKINPERIVIYTCVTALYDDLKPLRHIEPGVDYICFSDRPAMIIDGWTVEPVPAAWGTRAHANRYAKMHPHVLFPSHQISVYIDGNIEIVAPIGKAIDEALSQGPIALYDHPFRTSVFEEAAECAAIGFSWWWQIAKQMERYRQSGYRSDGQLFECNILFRRHMDHEVINLMERWWYEYRTGVKRDQLSLPFLAWRFGVNVRGLGPSDARNSHQFFNLKPTHSRSPSWARRLRGRINRARVRL